ncbi:hypothetical protein D9613_011014 [Agrocybe pediades]|uniref:F-box domain-containing protein n=1 Tax=Agrocybe pediades TaxID=84607 RepID=A0A8H4QLD3_9AGAR|nr:hypothetical protein D9613_011014 [Agrocybe pediades]
MLGQQSNDSGEWKITALRKKLDASTQRLLEAKQFVAKLQAEDCRIREELNAVSSAVMSLPPEILLEIFLFLCESRPMGDVKLLCSEHPPQFLIGAVCRGWRHIAWGTTSLWRTIAITFLSKKINSQTQLLEEWIKRSGTSLLDVYLDTEFLDEANKHYKYEKRFFQPPRATFAIICAVNDRWRKLHAPRFLALEDYFLFGSVPAPSLQELFLSNPDADYYYEDMETIYWDLRRSLHLKKLEFDMLSTVGLKINWQTITHLEIRMDPFDYLRHVVDCKALESLTIVTRDPDSRDLPRNETNTPFNLPSLARLSIFEQHRTIESILTYLTTPKLKNLSLKPCWDGPDDPVRWLGTVIQFITRSSCSLTEMDVTNIPVTCVFGLMDHIKTITRFSVLSPSHLPQDICDTTVEIFDPSHHPTVLPELEELTLKGEFSCDIDTLLDMIHSRVSPPLPDDGHPPVKKIRKINMLYHNDWFTDEISPEVFELDSLSMSTGTSITMTLWEG